MAATPTPDVPVVPVIDDLGHADEVADPHTEAVAVDASEEGGFRRHAMTTTGIQIVGVSVRYLSQAALARWLRVEQFGQYTYALNLGQLSATPCDLGLESSVVRFVPEYRVRGDAEREAAIVR